jgi:dTDP-4-amino-4,6-dideoxygalactose transaminase
MIFLSPPDLLPRTPDYVQAVLKQGWIAPNGPENKKFELQIADFYGLNTEQVATCSSGTSALHLIYRALGLGEGDTVFVPTLNFAACVNPLLTERIEPWFVDSEDETGGMSPELLEQAIRKAKTQEKRIKAVVVVHLMGYPANLPEIKTICETNDLLLIEDAAESLGAEIYNKPTSAFADITALSFNGNKIITTSGGGAVLSKHAHWINKVRFLRDQAKIAGPTYWHTERGFNYALSNISASIGVSEWESLATKLAKKKEIHSYYQRVLSNLHEIRFYPEKEGFRSNYWLTCLFISPEKRSRIIDELKSHHIESRTMWTPLHTMPFLNHFEKTLNGTAERWAETGLCLPSGTGLQMEEIKHIGDVIQSVFTR